ncbi:hypothetical protein Pcinc_033083 [Petrolisthes cinctipes]|uniref:UDP-glucuronosyltransferase n=1 Tax=Petrolisthes cinctipes TaxID=88211 RepID=A0AAE1K224_PETCI|nr:hypothetical protein Pcinc_033083 [Petrolisthes cinctipes]
MVKVAALGVVVVVVVMMVGGVLGDLPPPEAPYKILMLLPVSTKSHKNIFMALAETLADRASQLPTQCPCLSGNVYSTRTRILLFLSCGGIGVSSPRFRNKYALTFYKITARFPDLPPLLEIERNSSLALINSHFSMSQTVPILPSQVEVGAIQCNPAQPLPQDLETWISGAGPEGVIYFSLGSKVQGSSMPTEYRDAFIEAFRRLPHRVIWKYDMELKGVSDNVLIRKWLPQQDILGNNKVKVFITHGGLLSLQEAIYHATPLLSIPIVVDQPRNAFFVKNEGLGDMLVWEELTADALVNTLTEITTNPQYMENMKRLSRLLRDQLTTPMERAVYWTEYVIRHKGAPQLKCPAAELSWVEFLMLDVLAVLLVVLHITIYILYRILRAISAKIFGHQKVKSKEE